MADSDPGEDRILIVAPDQPDTQGLVSLLSGAGYGVGAAASAEAAMDAVHTSPPDLILLDLSLPEVEAGGLGRCLKSACTPDSVPILLIAAADQPAPVAMLAAREATDYLSRPLQPGEVLARVAMHLQLHAIRAHLADRNAQLEREVAGQGEIEKQLRRSEERYRQLVENVDEVLFAADERGVLTYISPLVEPLLGYAPPEVIGKHLSRFLTPEEWQRHAQENLGKVLAGRAVSSEYRILTKSGATRWVRTSSRPTLEDERVTGVFGIVTDVTEQKLAAERIQEQNKFLSGVLESLTHPFYVVNADDFTILVANSAARRAGLSEGGTCYALTHGRSKRCGSPSHPCPVQEIRQTGKPVTVEHIHLDAEGMPRHVEVRGYPLFDSQGRVTRVIEYALDITERKEAQEARDRSERRYRQLLDALQEGIWAIDPDAVTTFVNPRMAEMLGYTVEEMLGKHLFDFMDERGMEITRRNLERRAQGIREQHDFELLTKDGSRIYTLMETSPITDEQGNYDGAVAGVLDITARRRAEEALQKSEALLKETQRMVRLGGWELDLATHQVVWTDEVERIHEVPPGFRPTLENALSFYHPQDRPVIEAAIEWAAATGEPWDLDLRFRTAAGRDLWVRAVGRAELQDGKIVRLSGTFQDITERRLVEQAALEAREAAEQARNEEAERREEAEKRREIAQGLEGVMAALNSNQPLDQVLALIADHASRLLAVQTVAIYRLQATEGAFVLQAARGLPLGCAGDNALRIHQALGRSVTTRRPAQLFSTAPASQAPPATTKGQDLRPDASPGAGGSWTGLAVPVLVKDQAYGAMLFYSPAPRTLSHDEIELAQAFCDQVALAVESSRLREQVEQAAVSAERSRLARDLHDSVTQSLFSASLVTEVLEQVWERDPAEAIRSLEQLRRMTRGALAEMRALLLELRPTALLDSKLDDLLRQLAEALAGRADLAVTMDVQPVPALPPEVHVTFYRIAQETLQNVAKHAEADRVTVGLAASFGLAPETTVMGWQGEVRLRISDNGKGFDPASHGAGRLGLRIMRERAEGIGANLIIDAGPGRGTRVTLAWQNG